MVMAFSAHGRREPRRVRRRDRIPDLTIRGRLRRGPPDGPVQGPRSFPHTEAEDRERPSRSSPRNPHPWENEREPRCDSWPARRTGRARGAIFGPIPRANGGFVRSQCFEPNVGVRERRGRGLAGDDWPQGQLPPPSDTDEQSAAVLPVALEGRRARASSLSWIIVPPATPSRARDCAVHLGGPWAGA